MMEEVNREAVGQQLQTVRDHIRVENAHDLAAVMETFGSTANYDDEPWNEHYRGREAVQSFYETLFNAVPDLEIAITEEHVSNNAVIVECVVRGTHQGAWRGLPPTRRRIEIPLCGVYTFGEDGKLAGEKIYYDRASVLRQCGVFREPTDTVGRFLMFLNHPITIMSAWVHA
ncbi:MAG TPA: ester cyclase [Casimicrobiaceae bacterium]|jgi:steroid delta-isomerase-like uncharacterized protein